MGSGTGTETGSGKRRPRLGLLTSFLPKLTSRPDSQSSPDIARKPVPPASSTSSYTSPTSTAPTMTTGTARTSEDSKSSSRFESGTGSTALSPIEQSSPFFETGPLESTPPKKKLHKVPAMPSSPPPPPPTVLTKLGTPSRLPAVTATQATPPSGRRADRSPSPEHPPSAARLQPNRLQPRQPSPAPNPRGRSVSAQPPVARGVAADGSRAVSSPVQARSQSKPPSEGSPPATADKRKRKSWFPGARSRANSDVAKSKSHSAWLMSPDNQVDYNTALLVNGEKVPELWNEAGNVLVYLHPKNSNRGPCFKVADHIFSHSAILVELLVTEMMSGTSHNAGFLDVAPADGPVTEGHLYLPLGNTDLERLVAARNLFAFLTHQPLVGTSENPTLFAGVLQVAGLLRRFNFSCFDGSSFGESVDAAFDLFMDHTGIADVRHSREKTLEALILAEQMKSWNLYNEAFAHAVGKYESLLDLKSPLYDRISVSTRQRMDRAHLDLANRQASVNTRLEAFEFPSLFAGIASSTSTEEYKNVKFKEWRNSFSKMRSFALGYYKGLFGNWPPRARSKKNYFSQSGLNRQCLKILYSDFCALYDLLVDRQSITPRVIGEGYEEPDEASKDNKLGEASISALRKVLGEFDKSSPPVLPPIPFDVPKLPSMTAIYENYHDLPAKKQAKYSKALQPHELQLILIKSRNIDTDALNMPFLLAYKDYELKESKGTNPADLADQRIGNWLFLYVVLQSLPMLVVDAPGLRYTEGVEDFLCEAPQGNPPWTEDAGQTRKMWFQTGSSNVVELSADVVMFSVEGIYMRSHCWLAAKDWDASSSGGGGPPPPADQTSPLQPPRAIFRDMDPFAAPRPSSSSSSSNTNNNNNTFTTHQHQQQHHHHRSQSPGSPPSSSPHLRPRSGSTNDRARQAFRASIAIGLEPLPLPAAPSVDRASRVLSIGSMSSGGGGGGGAGPGSPGFGTPGPGSAGLGGGGGGNSGGGDVYQLGLRVSRSAVNLGGAGGGDYLGQPRKSSYGGFPGGGGGVGPSNLGPGHHAAAGDSLGGGSTFDDILKGMDGKGKKKKKLFF
ncbi:hypothetical protein C8A01DRAFT_39375 [Parachaetomium inaequale]|uniref:DUF8004 domain-containing protein n=1 Tax=Parachaetomium inaequale TaxID=2588326 RepID=A0AAN6PD46_9PEZI|nr:hypothetical protein C8A01DRAFT_39375 [Parachaetomium inaequale]